MRREFLTPSIILSSQCYEWIQHIIFCQSSSLKQCNQCTLAWVWWSEVPGGTWYPRGSHMRGWLSGPRGMDHHCFTDEWINNIVIK
jgi:hypothetical protein